MKYILTKTKEAAAFVERHGEKFVTVLAFGLTFLRAFLERRRRK